MKHKGGTPSYYRGLADYLELCDEFSVTGRFKWFDCSHTSSGGSGSSYGCPSHTFNIEYEFPLVFIKDSGGVHQPVFVGDTYYSPTGCEHTAPSPQLIISSYTKDYWSKCTLTPPKTKSVLDGKEFNKLLYGVYHNISPDEIKQFIRDHFEEKN
jgi:hypothetical protein